MAEPYICGKEQEITDIQETLKDINHLLNGNGDGLKTQVALLRKEQQITHEEVEKLTEATNNLVKAFHGLEIFKNEMEVADRVREKLKSKQLNAKHFVWALIVATFSGLGGMIMAIVSLIRL